MANVNLGQVAPVPKGEYSSMVSYLPLNTVTYKGGQWLCLKAAKGKEPGASGSETYWQTMTIGIQSVSVAAVSAGVASLTITYTDGQSASYEFDTSALAVDSVGTDELKKDAVTTPKVKDEAITEPKLAANAVTSEYTGTLLSAGWSASGSGFIQSLAYEGLKGQNPVIPDLDRTNLTGEELANASDAYANILKVTTTDGSAEYYSSEQPEIDLPVKLLEVKK